jgi:SNF2 family DNA or RNA helicase
LLVAYDFEHDLARLKARLGNDTPHIGGGVTPKRTAELEAAWNRGDLPVLLGHPASIGHGLNLQAACHHVCVHSPTWDYELDDQFVRRVLRQGSRFARVFVHRIVAARTVDEAVLGALRAKGKGQQALFDALRKMRRN